LKKILFLISALVASLLYCDESLESLLDDVTEIATKTKLNIDYQPSVVSVLKADKLKKIGVSNLFEAIGMLPGVETSMLHPGWKQVIIRGNYSPDTFVFDKYKLYIDGVDIGSDLYSTSYYYLDFPIELIERIEVLRGSASTIYGPGAFSGAINVITKSSINGSLDEVFTSIGSYDYTKIGFVKHIQNGNWKIALDGYHQHSNKEIPADPSFVSSNELAYSRSDYNSLESFEDFSFGIRVQNEGTTLLTRFKSEVTDNFYGLDERLEPVRGGYQKNESATIEIKNQSEISKDIKLDTKVGLKYYKFKFDTVLYQEVGYGFPIRLNPTYEQLNPYIGVTLHGNNFYNHTWMVGAEYQKIDTIKNLFGVNLRTPQFTGPTIASATSIYLENNYGFLNGDNDQNLKSIFLQDIYSLNDQIDFSANLRLDTFSLFGSMLSYRFGSVYRLDENNIFKAIYGRSYRAPSYVEAFQAEQDGFKNGNSTLNPEYIDTYELAYTYKDQGYVLRANIFYSIMKDVIDKLENEPNTVYADYANHMQRSSKGFELEYTQNFRNDIELMANFSYVRSEYFTPDYYTPVHYNSPLISQVLAKSYLLYPISEKLSFNTAAYYNGPKKTFDGRPQIHSTLVMDETVTYLYDKSSKIMLSVKNLFDTNIIYPSYNGNNDGIQREGRHWLVTYEKRF